VEFSFQGRMMGGSVDGIVVGCGVIGLSVAVSLQEAGLDVRVLTAAPPSNDGGTSLAGWQGRKRFLPIFRGLTC
jgi:glycine/D-amino acid oxidase-like deaminating enzyme